MDKGKFPYYVVSKGCQSRIYTSWLNFERQVVGFKSCKFRGFYTYGEALVALRESQQNKADQVGDNVRGEGSSCGGGNNRS